MTIVALQRDFAMRLRGDATASEAAGMRVYRNTYRAQLIACLQESFARLRLWIGDDTLLALMATHIDRFPPNSWTLDAYARDFPQTVAAAWPDDPEVGELAWLDLALADAFVAADAPVVRTDALGEIDWDDAVFTFVPSLDIAPVRTNAGAIWSALSDEATPPDAALLGAVGALLVWRQDQMSRFRTIEASEYRAILSARAGATFGTLCAALVTEHGDEAGIASAGTMLGQWLAAGLVSAIAVRR